MSVLLATANRAELACCVDNGVQIGRLEGRQSGTGGRQRTSVCQQEVSCDAIYGRVAALRRKPLTANNKSDPRRASSTVTADR